MAAAPISLRVAADERREGAMEEHRIRYVGPRELRDGHVLGVERAGDRALVRVRGADGRELVLEFTGVTELTADAPVGMLLFGLAELETADGGRRYFLANEEEWDDAGVEIAARDFRVLPPATARAAAGLDAIDPRVGERRG